MYFFSFRKDEAQLDILINNATIMHTNRAQTIDGFEMHFGVNHLGHFLLTNLLLNMLKATSRIITVSSWMHRWGQINKEDIMSTSQYSQWSAYSQSKLANVLFTRHLSKLINSTGVTVNCLCPGIVRPKADREKLLKQILMLPIFWFCKTAKSGAQTIITLALDQRLRNVSGKYFSKGKVHVESKIAQDDNLAEWLWCTSEQLTKLKNLKN